MNIKDGMPTMHPGEFLREEYLLPLDMGIHALAKALRVSTSRINDIVQGRRAITADTAQLLARYFGGDAQSWLNLQAAYDQRMAKLAE
jgi:addiction module HigA family antidote